MAPATQRHVALLRGINVGGRNKLPMKALAAMFENAGCDDVATYIQSGNVTYSAKAKLAKEIPQRIGAAVEAEFGFTPPITTRTAREFAKAVEAAPFEGGDTHVLFLADKPSAAQLRGLDADRSPPDEFVVQGREIFLHLPNGVARTKLTNAYFDKALDTISTARNWRTTLELLDRLQG